MVGPFISLIIDPEAEILHQIDSYLTLINVIIPHQQVVVYLSAAIIIIYLIKSGMTIMINFLIINFSNHYIERNSSEYIQAANNYSLQYTSSLHKLVKIISEGFITVFIISFLAWINWEILILLAISLVILVFVYDKVFRKALTFAGEMQNRYNIFTIQAIQECIKGFKEIRVLGKEKFFENLVEESSGKSMDYATRSSVISSSPRSVIEAFIVATMMSVIIASNQIVGNMSTFIPTMAIFGMGIIRLLPATTFFSSSFFFCCFRWHI